MCRVLVKNQYDLSLVEPVNARVEDILQECDELVPVSGVCDHEQRLTEYPWTGYCTEHFALEILWLILGCEDCVVLMLPSLVLSVIHPHCCLIHIDHRLLVDEQ